MDREFLIDLFSPFGPVTIRRMFSGFGISADGVNFALVIQGAIYLRADAETIPRFQAEGTAPFHYTTRLRTVTVGSYWRLPDRLLDDPDELAQWARASLAAAERAALTKTRKPKSKPRAAASAAKPKRVRQRGA
ncbi:TfoX-like [Rhodopseudomonas palustris HaA2]|uniref:TfoX-like n=1 Tax=Rhodopseudomonas palustris (strain HaA2) TaxID=316058 RepID=Q2IVS1_RHOP2|nr:TfoX/Sxy family protein [Rhodopseudomonas palustris]ABD07689.1 TfoX-like [Rhodopseudomonas palustris HaA2]